MSELQTIGIFGGTFDPIHLGHLRAALEVKETLNLDTLRIVPSLHPPHRTAPIASATHRLKMASLAISGSELTLDDQEMHRMGPSYSIDTLMALRRQYPQASLCMVVGLDAFLSLPSWYQWEKLIQLANIVVICRAGFQIPPTGMIGDLLEIHSLKPNEKITEFQNGKIMTQPITTLDISASHIRSMITQNKSPRFLLPEKVLEYIQDQELYGYNGHQQIFIEEVK